MQIGIIGLPFVGKTTVFNAVTAQARAVTSHGPAEKVHHGVIKVPDSRLDFVAGLFHPRRVTPAEIEYLDVAGITGETHEKKTVEHEIPPALHEVAALAQVVRTFSDPAILHISGSVDPRRDIEKLDLEIFLADLVTLEKRMERVKHGLKMGKKEFQAEFDLLSRCQKALEQNRPLRDLDLTSEESHQLSGFGLLSIKPMLYLFNIDETDINGGPEVVAPFADLTRHRHTIVYPLCAKIEMELAQLPDGDRPAFMEAYGIKESALDSLIHLSYQLLGLISFFTASEPEVKAWAIPRGTTALKAAGTVHSDMERGFIRAEVVAVATLRELGDLHKVKEKGLLRLEGKEYPVQDGDLIHFRFHV